jgi:hypothetical protein
MNNTVQSTAPVILYDDRLRVSGWALEGSAMGFAVLSANRWSLGPQTSNWGRTVRMECQVCFHFFRSVRTIGMQGKVGFASQGCVPPLLSI